MNAFIRWIKPDSLKNRLFLAFLLLIILPFSALQIRNHTQVKSLYENRISEQNQYQLDQVKQTFEQIRSDMLMTALQLEKERGVITALNGNSQSDALPEIIAPTITEKENQVLGIFSDIKSKLLPAGDQLHYALSDLEGHIYFSFEPNPKLTYRAFMDQGPVKALLAGKSTEIWVNDAPNDTLKSDNSRSQLINLFMLMQDSGGKPLGVLRVSFDYQMWLGMNMDNFLIQNDYYILDEKSRLIYESSPSTVIPSDIRRIVANQNDGIERKYQVDEVTSSIINSSHIFSVQWDIVSQFPLEVFFGDIRQMNREFFLTFFIFTLIFIIITFFTLSAITRPLMLLKKNMSQIIEKNFTTFIRTDNYKGEILEIADTFNTMSKDLNRMVNRLKMEERQKEAIRFQMLLQQMNPHFLLNTLNTIKWNVMSNGDQASAEICLSLGKLLETSLNSESDLIHLSEELELVEAYAGIQNFRYDHRFEVRYEYDEKLLHTLVPKLSLQPLVENAIEHGLVKKKTGGVIVIRIYENVNQKLILEVEDNGSGPPKETVKRNRKGIGIKNLKERLQLLFRDGAGLELFHSDQGTLVRMHMPLLNSPPFQQGEERNVENTNR